MPKNPAPLAQPRKATGRTVALSCPHCKSLQEVRPDGLSIFCSKCHLLIDIQKALHPRALTQTKEIAYKNVPCFRCQVELATSPGAQSVMCKKCGYRNDLQDYHVKDMLSRDLETHGSLDVPTNTTVLNSTAKVKEANIAGKFIGKLTAQERITLKAGAIFEGGLQAPHLILESHVQCHLKKGFKVERITLAGQFHGKIQTSQTVELKSKAVFLGSLETRHLILEDGAFLMGEVKISSFSSR
ncbi:MAG: polymer-forming cytoskeletal protein [Chlamydiae bacterium]|nr:polymer-forming cytoskeletal protein [Chlamydiota bacterium]MBI3265596.1 polymer-forming cytoskeletal protein [Chlamydiota bacterium]